MSRPARLRARQVAKDLKAAVAALGRVTSNTDDYQVSQLAEAAQTAAAKAERRAALVLKDLDLRDAAQSDLGLDRPRSPTRELDR